MTAPRFSPVRIDLERCKGCGLCVDACRQGLLSLEPERVNRLGYHPAVLADPEACTADALCARMCPDAAITVFARPRK